MLNRSRLKFALILTLAICAVAVASHQSHMKMHAAPATGTASTNPNEIAIANFSFEPATLTVKAGTTVTWVNHDDEPHTATATDKRFNSKTLDNGDRFSQEFNAPGVYNYYCALHPKMTGKIIVK
jgi:plastocyanin